MKINSKTITKNSKIAEKSYNSNIKYIIYKKRFYKLLTVSLFGLLMFYASKGTVLFNNLQLDKIYKRKIKQTQIANHIDLEFNDLKINEFEEKYGINKQLNEKLEKLQYGNVELNKKEDVEEIKEEISKNNYINLNSLEINSNVLNMKDEKKNINIEEREIILEDNEKRNIRMIKSDHYEQITVYDKTINNPDPRVVGSTIVFDSRLDKNKNN